MHAILSHQSEQGSLLALDTIVSSAIAPLLDWWGNFIIYLWPCQQSQMRIKQTWMQASGKLDLKEPFYRQLNNWGAGTPQVSTQNFPATNSDTQTGQPIPERDSASLLADQEVGILCDAFLLSSWKTFLGNPDVIYMCSWISILRGKEEDLCGMTIKAFVPKRKL